MGLSIIFSDNFYFSKASDVEGIFSIISGNFGFVLIFLFGDVFGLLVLSSYLLGDDLKLFETV